MTFSSSRLFHMIPSNFELIFNEQTLALTVSNFESHDFSQVRSLHLFSDGHLQWTDMQGQSHDLVLNAPIESHRLPNTAEILLCTLSAKKVLSFKTVPFFVEPGPTVHRGYSP